MNTIWDADCRHHLLERFEKLKPDAKPAALSRYGSLFFW